MTFLSFFRSGLMVLAVLAFSGQVQAQEQSKNGSVQLKPLISVVLDMDEILANSTAMKGIREQLSKFQAELQSQSDVELKAIQQEEAELNRKRTMLAPEAFAEERKKFQERFVAYQRKAQESTLRLNKVRAQAMSEVSKAVQDIVTEAVENNNIAVVYHKKATYMINASLDITKIVYEALNQRLPSVTVADPSTVKP